MDIISCLMGTNKLKKRKGMLEMGLWIMPPGGRGNTCKGL